MVSAKEAEVALQGVLRAALANCEPPKATSEDLLARLLKHAHLHKVVPLVRESLKQQLTVGQLEVTDGLLATQRSWVQRVLDVLPEQCVVVKGPVLAAVYPSPATRYYADVDLLVPSLEALRVLSQRLEKLGLRAARSAYVRTVPRTSSLAQFSVRYQLDVRRPGFAGVECHAISYPVTWSWGLDAEWFAENTDHCHGAKPVMNIKGTACILLADMLLSKRQKHRDLIDAHFLFKRLSEDEIYDVADFAVREGVESCVELIHDRFDQTPFVQRPEQLNLLYQLVRTQNNRRSSRRRNTLCQNVLLQLRSFAVKDVSRHRFARKTTSALLRTRRMQAVWKGAGLVQEVPFQSDTLAPNSVTLS